MADLHFCNSLNRHPLKTIEMRVIMADLVQNGHNCWWYDLFWYDYKYGHFGCIIEEVWECRSAKKTACKTKLLRNYFFCQFFYNFHSQLYFGTIFDGLEGPLSWALFSSWLPGGMHRVGTISKSWSYTSANNLIFLYSQKQDIRAHFLAISTKNVPPTLTLNASFLLGLTEFWVSISNFRDFIVLSCPSSQKYNTQSLFLVK